MTGLRLLVTRPEPDAGETAARLRTLGHDVFVQPILRAEFFPPPVDLPEPAAIVFTSRNAVRAVERWPAAMDWRSRPAFAVGRETAALARAAGFGEVHPGDGDAAALAERIAADFDAASGAILYPAARHRATDLESRLAAMGFAVTTVEAYRMLAAESFDEDIAALLRGRQIEGALFFSRRTSDGFRNLVEAAGLADAVSGVVYYALSDAAAEPLRGLGARIFVASRPDGESLLALLPAT